MRGSILKHLLEDAVLRFCFSDRQTVAARTTAGSYGSARVNLQSKIHSPEDDQGLYGWTASVQSGSKPPSPHAVVGVASKRLISEHKLQDTWKAKDSWFNSPGPPETAT